MRHIVLASHGNLAACMKETVELIAGPQPAVLAVCAYVGNNTGAAEPLAALVADLPAGDELIIVTDVLGGSVNNDAAQFVGVPRVHVVTGMSLGLVLSLVGGSDRPARDLLGESVSRAREQLRLMEAPLDSHEDDF